MLPARSLETPSEAPSKPYKACRRCSKGNYSAVVGEIGKTAFTGAFTNTLAPRLDLGST